VRRITGLGWALIAVVVVTVVLLFVAPKASGFAGIVLALLLLAMVTDAVGSAPYDGSWSDLSPAAMEEGVRRRGGALRRLRRPRDWDRRAPDVADEPAEAIWARERARRGLG
jgi:hypothetical protein